MFNQNFFFVCLDNLAIFFKVLRRARNPLPYFEINLKLEEGEGGGSSFCLFVVTSGKVRLGLTWYLKPRRVRALQVHALHG